MIDAIIIKVAKSNSENYFYIIPNSLKRLVKTTEREYLT